MERQIFLSNDECKRLYETIFGDIIDNRNYEHDFYRMLDAKEFDQEIEKTDWFAYVCFDNDSGFVEKLTNDEAESLKFTTEQKEMFCDIYNKIVKKLKEIDDILKTTSQKN